MFGSGQQQLGGIAGRAGRFELPRQRVDVLVDDLEADVGMLGRVRVGDPPDNQNRIGDGLSAMQWVSLLTDAGFESIDILLRDAEKIVLASVKP